MEIKRAEYESNMQSNANQVCELNSQLLQKDVDIEGLRNELENRRLEDRRENEQKISQLEENLRQKVAEMKEAQDKISCMNDDLETQIMDKMTAEEDNESLKANEKTLKDEIEELKMQKEELNQKLQKASEKERELSQVRLEHTEKVSFYLLLFFTIFFTLLICIFFQFRTLKCLGKLWNL